MYGGLVVNDEAKCGRIIWRGSTILLSLDSEVHIKGAYPLLICMICPQETQEDHKYKKIFPNENRTWTYFQCIGGFKELLIISRNYNARAKLLITYNDEKVWTWIYLIYTSTVFKKYNYDDALINFTNDVTSLRGRQQGFFTLASLNSFIH